LGTRRHSRESSRYFIESNHYFGQSRRYFHCLILSGGILYGTANLGGSLGNGTVFRFNTDGTGFTNLYSLNGHTSSDGTGDQSRSLLSGLKTQ
jgi:uncharacterized repeat protein (TIGR03803 family)